MKTRHAATLALVGWYLMMPPMQVDLDSSCMGDSIFGFTVSDVFRAILGRMVCSENQHCVKNPNEAHNFRCHSLEDEVARDTPFGNWHQVGEFETLGGCEAAYAELQKERGKHPVSRNTVEQELLDEGTSKPSDLEITGRATEDDLAVQTQGSAAKCIASDDPRLQGK
jgi:hypothetical protein